MGSLLFAVSLSFYAGVSEAWAVWQAASWLTALDSMCSDLLNLNLEGACDHGQSVFRCGNFGLVILCKENRNKVLAILKEMVRITMMRCAQSGGAITYVSRPMTVFRPGATSVVAKVERETIAEVVLGMAGPTTQL